MTIHQFGIEMYNQVFNMLNTRFFARALCDYGITSGVRRVASSGSAWVST